MPAGHLQEEDLVTQNSLSNRFLLNLESEPSILKHGTVKETSWEGGGGSFSERKIDFKMSHHRRVAPYSVHVENGWQCVLMCVKRDCFLFFNSTKSYIKKVCENLMHLKCSGSKSGVSC